MSRIHFFEKGEGQPLVLIHGFCETGEMWLPFAEKLSAEFRVICPDLPGFGQSPLNQENISLEELAVLLQEWMQAENIHNPLIIGHSLGGYVTLALLEWMGHGLKGIGLFNSTCFADDQPKKEMRDRALIFLKKHGAKKFVDSFVPQLFPENRRVELSTDIEIALVQAQESSLEGLLAFTRAMRDRKDRSAVLQNFTGPKLLIAGTQDSSVKIESSRAQSQFYTHYHEIEGMGHMGMIEEKKLTLSLIRDFVKSSMH
ncbi:alpha/beta fold hydrolase [Algoriphagus namhaensis]